MFDTSLTSDVTTNVQNEKQKIVIKSTIVPESYVCYFYIKKLFKFKTSQFQTLTYNATQTTSELAEIQEFLIESQSIGTPFMLKFAGVTTSKIIT